MWKHLNPNERAEMAVQLQNLSIQCEGSPVSLNLENGTIIPPANLTDLPYCSSIQVKNLPQQLRPQKIELTKIDSGPFLFTPLHFGSSLDRRTKKSDERKIQFDWVQHELSEVVISLTNPLPFELSVAEMRLLSNGIVFEAQPNSVVLEANQPTSVTLTGTPIEVGDLLIRGYSTHTLGVKSNCELKDMLGRNFPPEFKVNVIPSLPKMNIKTSAPHGNISNLSPGVVCSAVVTIYNGETQEIIITLSNDSDEEIEYIDCQITGSLDTDQIQNLFVFSNDEIKKQLPLHPKKSLEFIVKIFGDAKFIGSTPPHYDTQICQSSTNLLHPTMSTINSRMSSPTGTPRRNELSSSFRSSGHSSLNTTSLNIATGNINRQIESILKLRYSGGNGYKHGYCRQISVNFNVEMLPSVQITNWDVLPAEMYVIYISC